ncbi:MAG: hypothetical protein WCF67_18925, partial [Chitinophagaceae bacterium]
MQTDKIITLSLSLVAIILSVYNFNRSRHVTFYQDLDRLYMDVLKLAITYPSFVNPDKTQVYNQAFGKDDDTLIRYNLYAFMVWNVCETIYDRRGNKKFFRTWECIIKMECDLHRAWIENNDNKC